MQVIATARGALSSLLAEVVEGHVREHMPEAASESVVVAAPAVRPPVW